MTVTFCMHKNCLFLNIINIKETLHHLPPFKFHHLRQLPILPIEKYPSALVAILKNFNIMGLNLMIGVNRNRIGPARHLQQNPSHLKCNFSKRC